MDCAIIKKIHDTGSEYDYFVSETFEAFLKEHFAELFDGKTFTVCFEGHLKEVYMSNDLGIYLRNCKEEN